MERRRTISCVVMRTGLKWHRKDGVVLSKGGENKKCQGKVNSSNVCSIHRRGREEGEGGSKSCASNMATTGSSCVQSGSSVALWVFLHGQLWTGCPPTWPEVLHLGHLRAKFAGCD